MIRRVLVLGIDALDRELIDRFAPDLPHITALRRHGVDLPVRSTFPPDSDTAWATIATGLNPAEHGIVRFVDPLEKSYQIMHVGSPNTALRGRTFWEIAAQAGKRSAAIFPHLCHPTWGTGGLMVSRGARVSGVEATHPDVLALYPDPSIVAGVRGIPTASPKGLSDYYTQLHRQAQADAEFALRLLRWKEWDLYFVYWSTIDAIGHFFWSAFDRDDPLHQPGNPFEQVIPNTYRLFDTIIGRFLDAVDDETTLIVLSDHGHGGRPSQLVAVNEILRRAGFLVARDTRVNPQIALVEQAKRIATAAVSRYGMARSASRLMRLFPAAMTPFTRPLTIDWQRTLAAATDLSGIKSYPYGGIRINRDALDGDAYESARSAIIELMRRECTLADGRSLLKLVARREDLYDGPFVERYPDIVLDFIPAYGVGWQINDGLITRPTARQVVPGSHRGDTGTFLMQGGPDLGTNIIDLHDIAPLVLELLGVPFQDRDAASCARANSPRPPCPTSRMNSTV